MDELTGEFVSETRETLERIAGALIAWEVRPEDPVQLDEIFRFVHTVKGSCGFLDLPRIEALAHAAESALSTVRSGERRADGALVATMLAIIDRIGLLVHALSPDVSAGAVVPDNDTTLLAALESGRAVATSPELETHMPLRTVRIGVPLLEAMMSQVSDLVLVRNEVARSLKELNHHEDFPGFARLSSVIGELRESVTRTRMQPIDRLFATLPRLVRDTARDCGKHVTLEITGQDVEIDREMVEAIRDPLIHIVRNAIDHGIEMPSDRRAAGKPEISILRVIATQSGNQVSIEVCDDGRGIDTECVVRKAVAAKLIEPARASALDAEAAAALIFEPGLSTADAVTTLSGRGVGMDVVRVNVERLGGAVSLVNRPGFGLAITLRAPLTLSIVNALIVTAGNQRFAIPRSAIEEVLSLRTGTSRIESVGGGLVAVVRNESHPALSLAKLFKIPDGDTQLLVIVSTPSIGRYALAVDAVGDHEELVVRPMAPQLASRGVFAGQSLGDDGQPVVVLDPVGLAIQGGLSRKVTVSSLDPVAAVDVAPSILLATACDGRKIAIRALIVERLIDTTRTQWTVVEGQFFVSVDGAHLAARVIGSLPATSNILAVMLNDGVRRSVLAVASVHDLVALPEIVAFESEIFEGLLHIDGEAVLLVDAAAIFEDNLLGRGVKPVAVIALDDTPWVRAILAPLVEAAGYDVRFGPSEHADLLIHFAGDPVSSGAAQSVALDRDAEGRIDVVQYDRTTLKRLVSRRMERAA